MKNLVNSLTRFINERGSNNTYPQFVALPEDSRVNLIFFINKFNHLPRENLIGSFIFQKARHWKNEAKDKHNSALQYYREQILINCLIEAHEHYLFENDWVHIENMDPKSQLMEDSSLSDALNAFQLFSDSLFDYENKQLNMLDSLIHFSEQDALMERLKNYCQAHVEAWLTLERLLTQANKDPRYLRNMIESLIQQNVSTEKSVVLKRGVEHPSNQQSSSITASASKSVITEQPPIIIERKRVSPRRQLTECAFDEPSTNFPGLINMINRGLSFAFSSTAIDEPAGSGFKHGLF